MKRSRKLLISILMVLTMACFFGMVAEAKSAKTTTNWKKAKWVKTGTTTMKLKNPGSKVGYVKFKAPKKGTYVFKVSNFATNKRDSDGKDSNCGFLQFYYKSYNHLLSIPIKYKNKKVYTVDVCTWDFYRICSQINTKVLESPEAEVKMKLKKGQTIWIASFFTGDGNTTYKLKIKKK